MTGLPGQAYAVIVRSGYAHGVINGIDTEEARAMSRVRAAPSALSDALDDAPTFG